MKEVPILVVGAGLSGLMMAAQLLRFGVQPMIIDKSLGPDGDQGYIFLSSKSMELLDQMGILKDLLPQGRRYSQLDFENGRQLVDLEKELETVTRFPFILNLPKVHLKRALMGYLTSNACKIRWGLELRAAVEDEQGAWVTLQRTDPVSDSGTGEGAARTEGSAAEDLPKGEEWRVEWLIGADGSESLVRKSLGIGVERKDFSEYLLRAELLLERDGQLTDLPQEVAAEVPVRLFRQEGRWVNLLPLSGSGRYLLMCSIPNKAYQHPSARSLQTFLQNIIGPLPPGQQLTPIPKTIRVEKLGTFRTPRNSGRCCFLIGEAASGLQGVTRHGNANGMLDAWNLGWKLAGVVQGQMDKRVLLSFHQERHQANNLEALSLFGEVMSMRHRLPGIIQKLDHLLIHRTFANAVSRKSTLLQLSALTQNYRHSTPSLHYSSSVRIKAGDRFPFLPIYNEKDNMWTDTHQAFRKNMLVLVILGRLSQQSLHILGQWIKQKYPHGLGLYYLPYSKRNHAAFEAFEMTESMSQGVLVRPDMHIAYMSNSLNIALFDNYLEKMLGWKLTRQFD